MGTYPLLIFFYYSKYLVKNLNDKNKNNNIANNKRIQNI